MKGRCLNRLTMGPFIIKEKTPRVGLEPTTTRLTAECSTIELSRITLESIVPSKLHTDLSNLYFRKPVISIPLRSISMILLRKTAPVNSHSSVNKFPHCVRFHASVFLRFWSSPRPISGSPLHVLPHFHSCPIYLILFQGSYFLIGRDISSWEGLHA